MAIAVDIKKLFEAGAHFGHKASRWHPKMAPFIHSKRDGGHIIDLSKTVESLDAAAAFINQTAAEGKQILLVSTKKQAQEIIRKIADKTNMPYVTERWLGGMLTNRNTMGERVKHLKDLELRMQSGQLANKYSKLEVQRYQEEIDQMNHLYGGIKEMAARLGAIFIVDIQHDHIAVKEATKLKIPIVAICDTNTDPTPINYPIPANDDAIKSIQLICGVIKEAIMSAQHKTAKNVNSPETAKTVVNDKPAVENLTKDADSAVVDTKSADKNKEKVANS